jgi:hypothetical protein
MDLIIINLMLIPQFWCECLTNLVLMPKKTGCEGHYNFFFFKSCVYVRLEECQENLRGEPLAFSHMGFARGFPHSVLLVFSQSYVEYDLRKNKIIVPFFC